MYIVYLSLDCNMQVSTADIDCFRHVLDAVGDLPLMKGISKAHHVYCSTDNPAFVYYRPLACQCRRPLTCDCYEPQKWTFMQTPEALSLKSVTTFKVNDFVVVIYNDKWFLGQVLALSSDGKVDVNYMNEFQENK